MRLSNGHVNARACTSPVKSGRPTASAEDFLREDGSGWPPLLATFAEANNDAVASFVNLFVSRRIQYKCGQCEQAQFVATFLMPWLQKARRRVVEMDALVTSGSVQLTPSQRTLYQGCVERLLSAIRDAQLEMPTAPRSHDKVISFAQPIAHRIVRYSCDRFSLRSVTDDDRGEFSLSPPPSVQSTIGGSPGPDASAWAVEAEDDDGELDAVYTARTSGVYYGDVVHGAASRPSTSTEADLDDEDDADSEAMPPSRSSLFTDDPLRCLGPSPEVLWAAHRRGHAKRLRLYWLLVFYGIPMLVVLGLIAMP